MSLADDVQLFFDFYLKGGVLNGLAGAFDGICRRQPAAVGGPPEYEPLPAALEEFGTLILPVSEQPPIKADFDPSKVMMLDLCAAERALVLDAPPGIEVVLIWVTDYPASVFPTVSAVQPGGRIVTADAGQPAEVVLTECLNRLWALMASKLAEVPLSARVVECGFEELDDIEQQVRTHEK